MGRWVLDKTRPACEVQGTVRVQILCKPGQHLTLKRLHRGSWVMLAETRAMYSATVRKVLTFSSKRPSALRLAGNGSAEVEDDSPAPAAPLPWHVILDVPITATSAEIHFAFRRAAMQNHPDRGGNTVDMQRLNAAREAAFNHLRKTQQEHL